jgi:hypothetical protein
MPRAQGQGRVVATKPRSAKHDESLAFSLQRRHPLIPLKPGSRTDIEVYPILRDLVLRHLLEEDPRPLPVRILKGRPSIPLIDRHPHTLEEVVPLGQRVSAVGQGDTRRSRVDVAQRIAPERRQGSWIMGIERDLKLAAHSLRMAAVPQPGVVHLAAPAAAPITVAARKVVKLPTVDSP